MRFLTSMWQATVFAVIVFGALPLAFSDPLRDRSFRSKAIVSGVLIVSTNVVVAMLLFDIGRYYRLWPHKAAQVALQVRASPTRICTACMHTPCNHIGAAPRDRTLNVGAVVPVSRSSSTLLCLLNPSVSTILHACTRDMQPSCIAATGSRLPLVVGCRQPRWVCNQSERRPMHDKRLGTRASVGMS